ncbi:DNA-directed RNA polymerase III subunit RPC4-like [Scleropages formosus]|uniref:DNA-directed RNA polymerase III subunit RPC4-like n=1 Tax=Scleropages formosus TaxID=113540 RepID=A0A0P7UQP5_SCLFO|nr:DNA-directed RNA polymerase III subunit RPC4-like [Scleropages formosus]
MGQNRNRFSFHRQKTESGPRRDRKETDRGRQRDGRGRGRGRPEVIQSHSIFEQGPAEAMMKKRGGWDGERETPNTGPSPIINIKKEKRETEEETKEILRMLERDNFLDDPHLHSDMRSCPVQLPLAVSGWTFKEELSEDTRKRSLKLEGIKKEEEVEGMEVDEEATRIKDIVSFGCLPLPHHYLPLYAVKDEPARVQEAKTGERAFKPPPLPEPQSLPELLDTFSRCKEEELLFVQLPDSLPGQPPTIESRPVKTEVQSADGQSVLLKTENSQEDQQEDNSCCLKDLHEGLVGRLLVRKSGRVQLILGQITLDLALGTPCSFLQELVAVATEGRIGDLTVLGHIKHKLVCSPDFQALLENRV